MPDAKKNEGPKSPRVSTLKKLSAATHNECAFPGCDVVAFDTETDQLVVEVCHIEGDKPRSARYRADQPSEERHGYDNLTLLCGHHHTVVDGDLTLYTVERLKEIKSEHERNTGQPDDDIADRAVTRLLVNYVALTIRADTVVWSQNQYGGQVARTIINEAPLPWGLTEAARMKISEVLRGLPSRTCQLKSVQGDKDSNNLATQLRSALEAARWTVKGYAMLGPNPPVGIQIGLAPPEDDQVPPEVAGLVDFLYRAKLIPACTITPDESCSELTVIIGLRPDS
jgi:hypothetical protein